MPSSSPKPEAQAGVDRDRVRRIVSDVVGRTLGPDEGKREEKNVEGTRARWVEWGPARSSPPPRADAPAGTETRSPRGAKPTVALGSDHSAVTLKRQLARYLKEELGHPVLELGADSEEPVDYPDVARAVGRAVAAGMAWRGIVLDAMGTGSTMAANKVPGIRCALCHDAATAKNAREHNDANLLALGARVVAPGTARTLVRIFLATPHAGGRHARRVAKIRELERAATP